MDRSPDGTGQFPPGYPPIQAFVLAVWRLTQASIQPFKKLDFAQNR